MEQTKKRILLSGGNVVDPRLGVTVRSDVLLEGDKIAAVGDTVASEDDAEQLDVTGLTVVPGIMDCEVHLVLRGEPHGGIPIGEPLSKTALLASINAERTVVAGITTVRDLGGRDYLEFSLRELINDGLLSGPRLLLAGRIVSITGAGAASFAGMYREADGADEVRKAAREQLREGADLVKVMATGAALAGEEPGHAQYTVDELAAAADEAHRVGKPMVAHAHSIEGLRNALDAGADTIGHGTFLHQDERLIARMAEAGVFLVPTLSLWRGIIDRGVDGGVAAAVVEKAKLAAENHFRSLEAASAGGVEIAMGTDAGTPYNFHGDNMYELELMTDAGLTHSAALRAATDSAARCLRISEDVGAIEPGKLADLVIVDGDPNVDVSCLRRKCRGVIKGGNVIHFQNA